MGQAKQRGSRTERMNQAIRRKLIEDIDKKDSRVIIPKRHSPIFTMLDFLEMVSKKPAR